jgi:mono/diheme cytochrome c family protein
VQLDLDIDAPHSPAVVPETTPSAARGAALDITYPQPLLLRESYESRSPAGVWLALRSLPALAELDDAALWDAVAYLWRRQTTPAALAQGEALYRQECAACHGETGNGDGVFAQAGLDGAMPMRGHEVERATAFTDPALLGASNALLEGKILRGGMGTGMPAWGTWLSGDERQALLDYLWTFQFPQDSR